MEVVVVFAILEQQIQADIKSAYALRRKRWAHLTQTIKHESSTKDLKLVDI